MIISKFGQAFVIDKHLIEMSDGDAVRYRKESAACDLGLSIMKQKRWIMSDRGSMEEYRVELCVFTPSELRDHMDVAFREKLQNMAANEKFLTDDQRVAVMKLSERF